MATYYDPITQNDLTVDESTILYLVKIGNDAFSIKGLSSGIDQLASDPTTKAKEYWLLETKALMSKLDNEIVFPNNELRKEPLSLDEVMQHLGFNPTKTPAKQFNLALGQQFAHNWVQNTTQAWGQQGAQHANLAGALANIPGSVTGLNLLPNNISGTDLAVAIANIPGSVTTLNLSAATNPSSFFGSPSPSSSSPQQSAATPANTSCIII